MATRPNNLVQQFHLAVLRDVDALTDGELLSRFLEHHDGEAFAAIIRRHGPMVWGVCRRTLGDQQDLEDAFQAVFLVLVRRAGSLREPEALGCWLHGVARRTAAKARSRRAKRLRREGPAGEAAEPASPGDPAAGDWRIDLDAALNQLPDRYRTAVVLCDLEQRTRGEVSRQFGVPEGTLSGWLIRGREMLAKRLSSHGATVTEVTLMALLGQTQVSAGLPALIAETIGVSSAMAGGQTLATAVVSRNVAILTQDVVNTMVFSKLKLATAVVLVLAVAGVGIGLSNDPPPIPAPVAKQPLPQKPAETPAKVVDVFGDPLPEGAVLRLGTIRYRVPDVAAVGFRPSGEMVALSNDLTLHVFPTDGSPKPKVTRLAERKELELRHAMSANAKYAAGYLDKKVVVWDVSGETAVEYTSLAENENRNKSFSLDGEWLAVEGKPIRVPQEEHAVIHLCHLPTKEWRQVKMPYYLSWIMAFAADGKSFAAACDDTVSIVDTKTAKIRLTFKPPRLQTMDAALSPDGSILALQSKWSVGGSLKPIRFFSAAEGKELLEWKGPAEAATWIRFTPDGKRLLVGLRNGVLEWDPIVGQRVRDIPGPTYVGAWAAFSPDGKRMAMHGEDAIAFWNVAEQKPIHPEFFEGGHTTKIGVVSVSPDGKIIATVAGRELRLWSASDGKPTGRVECHWCAPVPFLPDSSGFIVIDTDELTPLLRDAKTGKEIRRFIYPAELVKKELTEGYRLSGDGKTFLTEAIESGVTGRSPKRYDLKWDVATGKMIDRKEVVIDRPRGIGMKMMGGLVDSPDGQWQYAPGLLTNRSTKETIRILPQDEARIGFPIANFSPDSLLVLVSKIPDRKAQAENRGRLIVFDITTKEQVAELDTGFVLRVAASPDGRCVVVMNFTELIVWDLASQKAVRRFPVKRMHIIQPGAIAWTPDSHRVVLGEGDGTALVWDVIGTTGAGQPMSFKALDAAWQALAGNDSVRAYDAKWELVDHPDQATALLRDRLKPVQPIEATVVLDLIKRFDARDFRDREAASATIRGLGEAAVPHLKQAMKGNLSAEQKQRVEALLGQAASGEVLRGLHGVAVLEVLATEECRLTLENLAKGLPESKVTQEAARVLLRLNGRK